MDDIRMRDLSGKPTSALSAEEKRELARRFQEFSELVQRKGPKSLGLRRPAKAAKKRVAKWDPATMGKPRRG